MSDENLQPRGRPTGTYTGGLDPGNDIGKLVAPVTEVGTSAFAHPECDKCRAAFRAAEQEIDQLTARSLSSALEGEAQLIIRRQREFKNECRKLWCRVYAAVSARGYQSSGDDARYSANKAVVGFTEAFGKEVD